MALNEFEINVDKIEEDAKYDSGIYEEEISNDSLNASDLTSPKTESKSRVPEDVRLRINSRERQRMHDLNSALESLRQVMPYSNGPNVKKLSKMSTLLLARNYILMLTRSLEEMKKLVHDLSANKPASASASVMSPASTLPTTTLPTMNLPTSQLSTAQLPSSQLPTTQMPTTHLPTVGMSLPEIRGNTHALYQPLSQSQRYSPYKVPSSPYMNSPSMTSTPTRSRHHPYGRVSSTPLSDSTNLRPAVEVSTKSSPQSVPHKFSVASLLEDSGSKPKATPISAQPSPYSDSYGLNVHTGHGHLCACHLCASSPYYVPKFEWKMQ